MCLLLTKLLFCCQLLMTEASQLFHCYQLASACFPPSIALALVFVQLCDELDQEILRVH